MITLNDVCVVIIDCEHKTAPKSSFGYPSIRTTDIKNGRIDFQNSNRVAQETYEKWTNRRCPKPGDLILAREAPVGEVGFIPEGVFPVLGQRTVLLSPDREKVEPRYLHFLLLSPPMQHEIEIRSAGSTVHHLNMKDIRSLELPDLPTLSEQREIAALLGALDDKIELNRRMSATLEAMARALYRSWFVDFDPVHARARGDAPAHMHPATAALFPDRFGEDGLPEGWEMGTLGDLVLFNPKEPLKKGEVAPYLDMKALPTSGMIGSAPYDRAFTSGTKFRAGDTLLARITPCLENGKTALVENLGSYDIGWGSTEFIVMRGREAVASSLPYCVARDGDFREQAIQSMTGSSGRQRAEARTLANLETAIAPRPIYDAFRSVTIPLINRALATGKENQTLATLRDTLLPKLISGELRMRDAEALVGAVA